MRYAKKAILITFVIFLALAGGVAYWLLVLSPYDLPQEKLVFERLKPPSSGTLLDGDGQGVAYFGRNDPIAFYKPLDQIDKKLRDYVIMLEDAKFFAHQGFDVEEINNSFWANFKAGKVKRGGSGITQQLAKNLFLDRQRSYTRKLYEVPWTLKLESSLSKRQILELYLNSIEWGPGLAGAEAAARYFFGKSCSNLSPGEAMYLALVIPSPSRFNLIRNPGASRSLETKRKWFVDRLVGEKKIAASDKQAYLNASFGIRDLEDPSRAFPAPVGSAFRAPEWAEFLKPYLKGKSPRVSIVKAVQLRGNLDNAWTTETAPTTNTTAPTEGEDPNAPAEPSAPIASAISSTWCATRGGRLTGYWRFDEALAPSTEFQNEVQQLGHLLHVCQEIDPSKGLAQ